MTKQLSEATEALTLTRVRAAYIEGLKDGVTRFAWWKDGKQYVGTCGTTLKQALEEINEI